MTDAHYSSGSYRLEGVLCSLLAMGLLIAAALGPLGLGTVEFHMNRNAIVQYEGGEIVTMLAACFLLFCGWRLWQGTPAAAAMAIGPAIYAIYTMVTVVLSQEFELFPDGNSERFNFLYMGLTALGTMIVILTTSHLITRDIDPGGRWRTITMWVLGVKAAFFTLAWFGQIMGIYQDGWTDVLREQRMLFWLIKYLDLGFIVPIAAIAIWLLRSRSSLAAPLVLLQLGFTVFMMAAIAGMMLNMWRLDEEGGSLVLAIVMLIIGGIAAAVWVPWVRATAQED